MSQPQEITGWIKNRAMLLWALDMAHPSASVDEYDVLEVLTVLVRNGKTIPATFLKHAVNDLTRNELPESVVIHVLCLLGFISQKGRL